MKKYAKKHNDIILIRHAEPVINSDIPNNLLELSKTGIKQAQQVAKLVKNKFNIVLCSTSKRAIETAKIISGIKNP